MLVETQCNLCNANDFTVLANVDISPIKERSTLVRCNSCGLAYVNPRHPVQKEKQFYQSEYHEAHSDKIWRDARIGVFQTNLAKIESQRKRGRLLDVGCGRGYFLELAGQRGWETHGVELSTSASRYARQSLRLQVYEGELKGARFPDESFDVVTAWNVIDQLYDPRGELEEIHRILKKDGLLALRVSNLTFHLMLHRCFRALNIIALGAVGPKAPTAFHIYMFSPGSIKMMLEKARYVDVRVENTVLDPEVPALVSLAGVRGEKFIRYIVQLVFEFIYRLSFGAIVLGPSITVFARKA
ncbi:MAG: class I SAM-dependent methyltransferase [Planctomycetes bacterium]|nr:class I SAM-dependent methyltransferase [Planctomycetota bacterium]